MALAGSLLVSLLLAYVLHPQTVLLASIARLAIKAIQVTGALFGFFAWLITVPIVTNVWGQNWFVAFLAAGSVAVMMGMAQFKCYAKLDQQIALWPK